MAPKKVKKKLPVLQEANLYINAGLNNVIFSITDLKGDVYSQISPGMLKKESTNTRLFTGCKKSTTHAIHLAYDKVVQTLKSYNVLYLNVFIKGIGSAKDMLHKLIPAASKEDSNVFTIKTIHELTSVRYGGTRLKKARRT